MKQKEIIILVIAFLVILAMSSCGVSPRSERYIHPSELDDSVEIISIDVNPSSIHVQYWDMRDTTRHDCYVDHAYIKRIEELQVENN